MRRVSIDVLCDPCGEEEIETVGEELPAIAIGRQAGRVLAMCKEHRTKLYDPLAALLANAPTADALENGRATKKAPKIGGASAGDRPPSQMPGSSTGKMVKCPLDECDETRKSPSGIADHLRKHHSTTMYDAIGPDGVLHDVDGDPVTTPKPRRYAASA